MHRRIRFAASFAPVQAIIPALAIALAATGGPAFADGPVPPGPDPIASTNLSWDHCAGDGRISDRTFACDTNTGEDVIVVSMVLQDSTLTGIAAIGVMVDFTPVSTSLPQWWMTFTGQCRSNQLSVQTQDLVVGFPPTSCLPWYSPYEVLGVSQQTYDAPDRLHWEALAALPSPQSVTLLAGQEYNLCRIRLRHSKTVGVGACVGCTVPTCIGVSRFKLQRPTPQESYYFAGTGLNSVTWQGGYVASYPTTSGRPCSHPSLCPYTNQLQCTTAPVPTRGQTWGVIKALYR